MEVAEPSRHSEAAIAPLCMYISISLRICTSSSSTRKMQQRTAIVVEEEEEEEEEDILSCNHRNLDLRRSDGTPNYSGRTHAVPIATFAVIERQRWAVHASLVRPQGNDYGSHFGPGQPKTNAP